jgi:hypothetical protein
VDPFKGKMAFIRKSTRVMKSTGRIKPAGQPEAIPHSK